jgi:hypothetical protein
MKMPATNIGISTISLKVISLKTLSQIVSLISLSYEESLWYLKECTDVKDAFNQIEL